MAAPPAQPAHMPAPFTAPIVAAVPLPVPVARCLLYSDTESYRATAGAATLPATLAVLRSAPRTPAGILPATLLTALTPLRASWPSRDPALKTASAILGNLDDNFAARLIKGVSKWYIILYAALSAADSTDGVARAAADAAASPAAAAPPAAALPAKERAILPSDRAIKNLVNRASAPVNNPNAGPRASIAIAIRFKYPFASFCNSSGLFVSPSGVSPAIFCMSLILIPNIDSNSSRSDLRSLVMSLPVEASCDFSSLYKSASLPVSEICANLLESRLNPIAPRFAEPSKNPSKSLMILSPN